MKQTIFNIFISIVVCGLGILQYLDHVTCENSPDNECVEINEEPEFFNKSPEEGLMEALVYYNIKHPNIVYAQAVLETGHFNSRICKDYNNLFGLYNSKTKDYYKFNHWTEAIVAYIDMIEYKYKGGDYYEFLHNLPYAEDRNYIDKVRQIESNLPP